MLIKRDKLNIALFVFYILIIGISFSAFKASEIDDLNEQKDDLEDKLEINTDSIEELNDSIEQHEIEISTLNSNIEENETEIKNLEENIRKHEEEIEKKREELADLLVFSQKQYYAPPIFLLVQSGDSYMKTAVTEYNIELINAQIATETEDLSREIAAFDQQKTDLLASQEELKSDKSDLANKQTELEKELTTLEDNSDAIKKELASVNDDIVEVKNRNANVGADKQEMMRQIGISEDDFSHVDYVISRESGWNYTATNSVSGAYGLCQALPASKLASAGSDWQNNALTQLEWCDNYAQSRYGSWSAAETFWRNNHWW